MINYKLWLAAAIVLPWTSPAGAEQSYPPPLYSTTSQFTLLKPAPPAPDAPIQALGDTAIRLSRFRGKVIVLNFWAAWCAACIYELPSLDRLAAQADPGKLAIITVSLDRGGAAGVKAFLASHRLTHLKAYRDPGQQLGSLNMERMPADALRLPGLPATYIVDRTGRVAGYIAGAVNWDTPEAKSLLDYFAAAAP
jgi:thiol-disulfide isomerase/thioredoxin